MINDVPLLVLFCVGAATFGYHKTRVMYSDLMSIEVTYGY